jgi:hypothetical protein
VFHFKPCKQLLVLFHCTLQNISAFNCTAVHTAAHLLLLLSFTIVLYLFVFPPAGPVSSFLVISDPAAAKHVLRATDNSNNNIYDKGLVAEVSKFLFGEGFAVAGGDQWRMRRRAVSPSLHRCVMLIAADHRMRSFQA